MAAKIERGMARGAMAATLAAALLLSAGIANAAQDSGKVLSFDRSSRTLTLADGTRYQLAQGIDTRSIKPGQEVKVSYQMKAGKKIVSKVTPAQSSTRPSK